MSNLERNNNIQEYKTIFNNINQYVTIYNNI